MLFQNKHWARTVFLSNAAGEEFGKAVQCLTAVTDQARGLLDLMKFRKRFLSHRAKMTTIGFFEVMVSPTDGNFINEIKHLDEEVSVLIQARNITLYSDIFSDGTVYAPNDVVPEKMASDALSWAKGRLAMAEAVVRPMLEVALTSTDEKLKQKFDEFMEIMEDPQRRKALMEKLDIS